MQIDVNQNNYKRLKIYHIACISSIIFLFIIPRTVAGQFKYEREYKLEKEKVPVKSKTFIDGCCPISKVKWYGEESLKGKSIEAKLKYKGSWFSIEFDTTGQVQDVEKKIGLDDISQNTRLAIIKKLDSIFSSHKIDKIQVQWIGSTQVLYQLIVKSRSTLPHIINYEIIVKGKKDLSEKMYEILFSSDGSLIGDSEIVQRNTDNLDY